MVIGDVAIETHANTTGGVGYLPIAYPVAILPHKKNSRKAMRYSYIPSHNLYSPQNLRDSRILFTVSN